MERLNKSREKLMIPPVSVVNFVDSRQRYMAAHRFICFGILGTFAAFSTAALLLRYPPRA
jgi:hypothetical protein